ncbi:MAG TPA: GNAT family N-acetyltransferase [Gaiellaceae bacterium]|nr:GNAT family N-acetyltransferase [Gaiellaceae bacterium]
MVAVSALPTRGAGAPKVDLTDGLRPLRDEWTRLAAANRNIFATWEWNELWWRHFGAGRRLRVAVCRDGDEIRAIVPLFEWSRRPLRTLRLIGHGHGDRLGPICADDESETAAWALRLGLASEKHDVFVGDWVAGEHEWADALGARVVRRTGYPILHLGYESWTDFLTGRSRSFRKSVRHGRNRLERNHRVTFRSVEPATFGRDLDDSFRLHRARFRVHQSCLFCGDHEPFQREFAAIANERGWLRLLLMEIDGVAVATEYGFHFQDAYFSYQSGRDPSWNRYSIGFLLEVETIRRAFEEGAVEYRFLGGDEPYKYRYSTEDPGLETVVAAATGRGRLAAAGLDAAWRLPGGQALLRRLGS